MFKKLLMCGVIVALTGCATHRQSNELAGAAVGGIIGNAIGGKGGAAVGAVLGAGIGGSQPTQPQSVVTERSYIIREPARPAGYCRNSYHNRIAGCDMKLRNDPYFNRGLYNACIDQAKHQFNSCVADSR